MDDREVYARATYLGVTQEGRYHADWFAPFDATSDPGVYVTEPCPPPSDPADTCTVGSCGAFSHQLSVIYADGITFSGETSGSWQGEPIGEYEFDNIMRVKFHLDVVHHYEFFCQTSQGDWPTFGMIRGYVRLEGPASYLAIHELYDGVLNVTGRLGPGDYVLEAHGWGLKDAEYLEGFTYGGQFVCYPDTTSGLRYTPQDQTVACGGTATFSVGTTCASATYQWRKDLVPLANGGRVSGVAGPNLTIQNACTADVGYYDVIVTCIGNTPTPSGFAYLAIAQTTAVETTSAMSPPAMAISPAAPNPFQGSTSLAYATARPLRVRAEVYNALGAKVRTIRDAVLSGAGALTWDGMTRTGERAPAGIYFVRVEAEGGLREIRKVVLLK